MSAIITPMCDREIINASIPSATQSSVLILARSNRYHRCYLYNVLPSDLTNESAFAGERCKLFTGDAVLEEYIMNGSSVPRYMLKFEWNKKTTRSKKNVFCQTELIDNVHKWNETITEWSSRSFRIMMQCSDDRYVLLELQICDTTEDRKFRDILCRISEEFEIWAEVMGD